MDRENIYKGYHGRKANRNWIWGLGRVRRCLPLNNIIEELLFKGKHPLKDYQGNILSSTHGYPGTKVPTLREVLLTFRFLVVEMQRIFFQWGGVG